MRPASAWIAIVADPIHDLRELASKLSRQVDDLVLLAVAMDSDAALTLLSQGKAIGRLTTPSKRQAARVAWERALGSTTANRLLSLWQASLVPSALLEQTAKLLDIDSESATSNFHELQLRAELRGTRTLASQGKAAKTPRHAPVGPTPAPKLKVAVRPKYVGAIAVFDAGAAISEGMVAPAIASAATQLCRSGGLEWYATMPYPKRAGSGRFAKASAADVRSKLKGARTLSIARPDDRDRGISTFVSSPDASAHRAALSSQVGMWLKTDQWKQRDWTEAESILRAFIDDLASTSGLVQAAITGWARLPDGTAGMTTFESGLALDPACTGLRLWTDRWLRAPGLEIWLGDQMLSRLDPARLPTASAAARVGHRTVRVVTPRNAIPQLAEYLQPVLASKEDAWAYAERAYQALLSS